jgi:hypothetical protein
MSSTAENAALKVRLQHTIRYSAGNGDTERPSVVLDVVELSGYSSLLLGVADRMEAASGSDGRCYGNGRIH